ncbi:MAG: hypothetical protein ACJ75T_02115 [Solirubrobacterales bacterium]
MRRAARKAALGALLAVLACVAAGPVGAERTGGGGVVVSFDGSISPRSLPRHRPVPISVTLEGTVRAERGAEPPRLRRLEFSFGARGGIDVAGLPVCPRGRLRDATRRQALARCGSALVGRGALEAEVPLDPSRPLLASAGLLAFNGRAGGRPAVWVHAYSASPPVSFVLPFYLRQKRDGAFGILMRAPVAVALGRWPRLRSFQIRLGRRYRAAGASHSYLNASCPLPPRFNRLTVPIARASYAFAPSPTLSTTILRACRVSE